MKFNHFRTLVEALVAAPSQRPFITMWNGGDNTQTVTFGEFKQQAEMQAAHFQAYGLHAGDTVILVMPQGIALMTAFMGAVLLGAVPTILAYPNFKVEPTKYRLGLKGISANLRARLVMTDDAFPSDMLNYIAADNDARFIRSITTPAPSSQTPLWYPEYKSERLAFIQHSAGTTGLQKGVAISHDAVLRQLSHLATALRINDQDRIYSWLPLYHDMGLITCFMLPLVYHLPVIMQSPTKWVMQPGTMLQVISEYRCTLAWVPNFTLQFLARRVRPEDRADYDLSSLRALINCSEPVQAQSMDEFVEAYSFCGIRPNVLQSSYAMAENVFAVTQSGANGQPGPRRIWVNRERLQNEHIAVPVTDTAGDAMCLVSSGQCIPGNQVRIVSATGQDLPDGAVGEILVRSDSLFNGYYNRPDLTAKALKDGWYWSGDLGSCLDGEVYITGRKADLIIVAGKNIYPQDIEEIVCSHPAIHDGRAVAFGLYSSNLGTEDIIIVAEVENQEDLRRGTIIEREIRSKIVTELGVAVRAICLKPPRWIIKSTAGKPARSTTRDKLLAEHQDFPDVLFPSGEEK